MPRWSSETDRSEKFGVARRRQCRCWGCAMHEGNRDGWAMVKSKLEIKVAWMKITRSTWF
jgi:hypothetical protein